MDGVMKDFVRKTIKESTDFQTLTEGKLRKMFLEENSLHELPSKDEKIFSELVDQALGEIVQSTTTGITPTDSEIHSVEIKSEEQEQATSDTDSDFSPSISKRGKKRKKLLQSDSGEDDFISRRNSDHCSSGESNSHLEANSGKPNKKSKVTCQISSDISTDSEDDLISAYKSKKRSPMMRPKQNLKKSKCSVSSDSDDEPIAVSKTTGFSKNVKNSVSSDSEDEPIATLKTTGSSKDVKKPTVEKFNSVSSDSEDKPIAVPKITGSSKNVKNSVNSDSEDEPIATLKTTRSSKDVKKSTVEKLNSVSSDSEDEPIATLKTTGSSKNLKNSESSDSEDDPIATFKTAGSSKNVKKSTVKKFDSESSDSENEPIAALRSSKNTQKSRVEPFKNRRNNDCSDEKENDVSDKQAEKSKLSQFKFSSESDDEPLALKSKMNTNDSENNDSEDEPIAVLGSSKNAQKSKVEPFNNGESSDSENEPIATFKMKESSKNIKKSTAKKINRGNSDCSDEKENAVSDKGAKEKKLSQSKCSSESDDEPLALKSKMDTSDGRNDESSDEKAVLNKKATKNKLLQSECSSESDDDPLARKSKMDTYDGESSDSEDKPITTIKTSKIVKPKVKPVSKRRKDEHSSKEKENAVSNKRAMKKELQSKCNTESDDEPLALKSKMNTNDGKNSERSSEERKNAVSNKKATKRKLLQSECSSESDDEPLALKSKMDTNDGEISDSEDEPIAAVRSSKNAQKSIVEPFNNKRNGESSSEEKENVVSDEKAKKKKLPQSKHSSESDNEPLSLKSNKKSAKSVSSTEAKIERLKKYVRAAGMHIPNYTKLFDGCKTMKAKVEKLTDMLHKEGMKGRPTLEKCKKLKKRIETKKEVASLDLTNIIATDSGRPKRNARSLYSVSKRIDDDTSVIDSFSQLKDLIDSEASD